VNDLSQVNGVPEDVSGKIPSARSAGAVEQWMCGIRKTFVYELADRASSHGANNGYGLFHSDFSPKPAYNAVRNVGLLSDPGPAFRASGLNFTLSGNLTTFHHLLLQKWDGTFYLAIWLEQPSCQRLRHSRHGSSRSQTPHAKTFGSLSGAAHHHSYCLTKCAKNCGHYPEPRQGIRYQACFPLAPLPFRSGHRCSQRVL
jgi:hypothetical protein